MDLRLFGLLQGSRPGKEDQTRLTGKIQNSTMIFSLLTIQITEQAGSPLTITIMEVLLMKYICITANFFIISVCVDRVCKSRCSIMVLIITLLLLLMRLTA